MNYIKSIINSILTEEASVDDISDAIKKRYEVEITYKADDDKSGQGKRVIQPVALGKSKAGNLVVRAYQPMGDSKTVGKHSENKTDERGWKTFRLDKFDQWKPIKKRKFDEPPGLQYTSDGKYNPNGDGSMSEVLLQADFTGSQKYQKGEGSFAPLKQHNDEVVNKKREETPYYDLKKNIQKSYNGNNIDYIKRNIDDWQKSQAAKSFRKGSNQSSIDDMSKITDFGDEDNKQSVGPVTKNNTEYRDNSQNKVNYTQARKNGPLFKDDNNNIENKEENEYVKSREGSSGSTEINDER